MKALRVYQPRQFASLKAYYELTEYQKGGQWDPEIIPTIEWVELEINGRPADVNTYTHFIGTFGEQWERNILRDYGYSL